MSEEAKPSPSSAPGPSMLPKIMIAGFIASVVIVETVLFFYFVPSADDIAALAEAQLIKKVEATLEKEGEPTVDDDIKATEFALGLFSVEFVPTGEEKKYRMEVQLVGLVQKKSKTKLEELFKEHEMRFHDRIAVEMRNSTLEELSEKELGLIKRRILATSNELLGEPILQGIVFGDYQVTEL